MPRKLIFIFPGQASQYVGMGRDLYDHSPAARAVMDSIAALDGLSHIPDLCFNCPEELLTRTDNVQPAITVVSLMALEALRIVALNKGIDLIPAACAGHSLGEYAAHCAAGNLTLEQTTTLVRWRGVWMNEASQAPHPEGAMLAIMGLTLEQVEEVVVKAGSDRLAVANLNSPGQIIVSGEKSAVADAEKIAQSIGARRCVFLKVSGAWHSPLMLPAQAKMSELLVREITPDNVTFNPAIPVVANATANVVSSLDEMRDTLARQITSLVRWEACISRLLQIAASQSPPLFIEIGPGKVLKGLLRNINKSLDITNVEDRAGIDSLVASLQY
jgi:[acyl-carrier-protein] S-malonyltransferase